MEKKLYDLTVSTELEHLIPPLQEMELKMLTESLLENGCEMPLVVWDGVIVDGHNRYHICRENGIPFAIEEKEFEDMDAAKVWLIKNQLGRRNITDYHRCELVLPLEGLIKEEARKRQGQRNDLKNIIPNLVGSQKPKTTQGVLADMAGVSHGTFDKAKKIIESADEDTKGKLRRGEVSIHKAYTDLKKPKGEQRAEEADEQITEPIPPKQSERPKFKSLLDKPIFDRNQRTQIDGPILFQPVVSEEAMAAFEAAKRKEESTSGTVDDNGASADVTDDAPSANGYAAGSEPETVDTVEQDVQELIDDFLDELSSVLDGVDSVGAERILEMVRSAGERAVHTVESYMKKMEG